MTPPIIIKSPLLKFNESIISKFNLVIIDKIPKTEIIRPAIWYLFVFSILNKKHNKIIIAGIAVLKREAFITWVWTNDKYVKELKRPTLVSDKKIKRGKLFLIISLCFIISLNVNGNKISQTNDHLKKTSDIGGIFVRKANFPTIKFPAQNNVAQTNIKYALVFCMN